MTPANNTNPHKEAAKLTQILDVYNGADRFDKAPVDVSQLALDYSNQFCSTEPIEKVQALKLNGCDGALVPSENASKTWAIAFNERLNVGRKNFTLAHEFGHYLLHRHLSPAKGFECSEENIDQGIGRSIEQEADQFAAGLLMPFHDFRRQIPSKDYVSFDQIILASARYGVSITAAILRWLECTEVRAVMIVSNEGFIKWAKSSSSALKSGVYFRTRNQMNDMPSMSLAVSADFSTMKIQTRDQNKEVWFKQPCRESCFRDCIYDREITILQFDEARYQDFDDCDSEE